MNPPPHAPRRLPRRRWLLRGLFYSATALAAADTLWFERQWLHLRRFNFARKQPSLRCVHFTDLHHRGDRPYLQRIVGTINAMTPDFVCFTGDIMEETAFLDEALSLIQAIRAPVYGVPGNHDYWSGADFGAIARAFAATGGAWLVDEHIQTKDAQVAIYGATGLKPPTFAPPSTASRHLLLVHYPEWIQKLGSSRFDLILAGHTHGGQVRLPFYGALVLPFGTGPYDLGFFQTASGPLYVSAGLGYFHVPFRFCCRPDITLFEI